MFQFQEDPINMIRTSLSIEQNLYSEKNYQLMKFPTPKSIHFPSTELDPKRQWTPEEENLIFQLHNQHGNKWAIIAGHLHGRSDNSVKNHFYSRLRKGLRKLNKIINTELKKAFRQFKIIDLYKVIEASDQNFKEIKTEQYQFSNVGHGIFNFISDLKNRIFLLTEEDRPSSEQANAKIRKLISDLSAFSKEYKRKSKKNRRYSPMCAESVYRKQSKGLTQQKNLNCKQIMDQNQQNIQSLEENQEPKVEIQETFCKMSQISSDKQNPKYNLKQKGKGKSAKKSDEAPKNLKAKAKKIYNHFSEDEEPNNETEALRQQRLENFAENILKTFKSYFSFESFRSNPLGDELFQ